jgi:hypothetical protein
MYRFDCFHSSRIFKKKKDGRYRAGLCALAYSQIPGEDFMDTSSQVVDDVTIRTVITNRMIMDWESEVVDITTAFLHGEMEEAHSLARYRPSFFFLKIHLHPISLLFGGTSSFLIFLHPFLEFISLISFRMASLQPCPSVNEW